jgi:hypothetical protein
MPTWKRLVVRMSHEEEVQENKVFDASKLTQRKRTLICNEIEDICFMKPSESVSLDMQ